MNAPVRPDARTKLLKKLIVSVIRDGFQHLRMDDIAKYMDVSRATMYKYFSSKEDVMDGVVRIIVDYIERLEERNHNEDESYFGVWFQQLFEQSVSLVEYITDALMKDLQAAYPDLYNILKGVLQKREQHSLRFYRLGKDKGIFNAINEKFILLQDDLLLHEITSVKYLLYNHTTIKEVLHDYYQFKKMQLFKADKLSLVDDANINPVIEQLSEKFNRALM
ncbi:TetR/AcrR family transcriptional regulator [Paenibacillus anseongense]|uniref:TetR/AcrR family transcriptional regulator n=1 Tax=Paenibacillus anseongense TaxID=2682845 RepID=UPI002DBEBECD|nr:TetR/AcrR family transcriptional regulator [Paenibacillus anseongense]MEC0270180.1 TetR/AcrR family transcriptional regulator [Paenibacillus anseongense]